ncbi:MAG: hypothetical protein WDN03_17355 [Rhizomicrobium sp.]
MNIRFLPGLAAALVATSAQAAVSVIGPGPAQICYQAADIGGSPADYLTYCDQALAGTLTDADRAATLVNRGVLKLGENDYDSAAADFHAGLAIDADLGEAYIDLGAVQIAHKQYAAALLDIDKGMKLGSKKLQLAYYDRAMANEGVGNLLAAYDDYRQALRIAPDFTRASDELKRFKVVGKPDGI